MQYARKMVNVHERGVITRTELLGSLVWEATEAHAADVVASLPAQVLGHLRAYVDAAPRTEEGWARVGPFLLASYMPGTTREQIEANEAEQRRVYRRRVEVLRDIFGPCPRPHLPLAVLAWNDGILVKLAIAVSEERSLLEGTLDPHRLAVLADALEEAGCTDPDILGHFRQQGTVHVRGCWCVDLLLAKD